MPSFAFVAFAMSVFGKIELRGMAVSFFLLRRLR